ncbi:MAG: TadE/TadG family type IV pilus assembly protein [Bacillota bacterium]
MSIKNNRGQATVELALILPILLLILFCIMELGRIFSAYLIITNAAREGARQASIGATDTVIETSVDNAASTLETSRLTVSISPAQVDRITGVTSTVTVNYSVYLVIPMVSDIIQNPFPLQATSVMRVE